MTQTLKYQPVVVPQTKETKDRVVAGDISPTQFQRAIMPGSNQQKGLCTT
jgi:hypothetical protein